MASDKHTCRQSWLVPYQHVPRGPLYQHQSKLPRLPIPSLEQSCIRYLRSVRPLVTDQEYEQTAKNVLDFLLSGTGEELHQKLVKHAAEKNKYSSWLIDWWNDWAYFTYRDPVVFYVSYFFQFRNDLSIFQGVSNTGRAAKLVTAALAFRKMIVDESLPPESSKFGPATCASMYPYMFNACRIPAPDRDYTDTFPSTNNHLLVVRRGQFFYFDLIDADGKQLTAGEIDAQLQRVISLADSVSGPLVGALTSDDRDKWAVMRTELIKCGNKPSLDILESAVMVVALDTDAPSTVNSAARLLWHGDGINRWYDKSVQFIVCDNGQAGFLGEHSIMDGSPTLLMTNWCLDSLTRGTVKCDVSAPSRPLASPAHIVFRSSPDIERGIASARETFNKTVQEHDLHVLQFRDFGKDRIKQLGVSPDAFAQLALQLAYYRMHGHFVGTYESCSTRSFLHGRTEVIRSCTPAAAAFVHTMLDGKASNAAKHSALQQAANAHIEYANAAAAGMGVDRHFLGMRLLRKPDQKVPLFEDPVFARSCRWRLSTSTLASEYFDAWGFGEVVPDGFGVGYMVNNKQINYTITSRNLGAEKLGEALRVSMQDMAAVCAAVKAAQPTPKQHSSKL